MNRCRRPTSMPNPSGLALSGRSRDYDVRPNQPNFAPGSSLVSVAKRISSLKIWVIARFFGHVFLASYMCMVSHLHMEHVDSESPSDVARWLRSESTSLWPALLGSLSLRRSRCIRKNCPACRSGEQHQSYVLYGRASGRRVAVYVPEELVPEVQRSL